MVAIDTILQYSIANNEVWRYLVFVLTLALTIPIAKVLNVVSHSYLKKWASKTDTKIDDIVLDSLFPTIKLFVLATTFYFGSTAINQGIYASVFTKIFNLLLIIPVVYFLIRFSTEFIGYYLKDRSKQKNVNEAAIDLLMQIIRVVLFLIGILLILGNIGYNVSALIAGLGVGGLAFALAAQDVLKNFFAGISLIFDKTFGKGERVSFQQNEGFIEEVRMRSTKLRTYDGTLLTIPNAMLADNIVENVTKVPRVKVSMVIGVTYDTSAKKLRKAKEIINKALEEHKETDEKSAWIYFDNFGAYSLNIQVIYYAKKLKMSDWPARVYMKEDINFAIKEGFEKSGIEMAFPTQTIEMKK